MDFKEFEILKDVTGQLIDFILNLRQSGHPGGSRSKMHIFWAMLLSGNMKYDIRHPENPLGDRFILSAGHTIPLVYAALTIVGEAFRKRFEETKDVKYKIAPQRTVLLEDLLKFRHRGGLPGHAEFSGKTLFLKFNTGPSGHGLPPSVGEALALKRAGLGKVKVWVLEGEGGLTAGASHESKNSAWALGLDNLIWLIDWNDYGIDDRPTSAVVNGTPDDWFKPYGWNTIGCDDGHNWKKVMNAFEMLKSTRKENIPNAVWFKTRKGYGYGVYDNKSHGTPHKPNSEIFWNTRREFMEKYDVVYEGFGKPAPDDAEFIEQTKTNLKSALNVVLKNEKLVKDLTDKMVEIAEFMPKRGVRFSVKPVKDKKLFDYREYPKDLFFSPGEKVANRTALKKWGAWINATCATKYGRPLFLAASADLAESTNVSGFAKAYGDFEGYGWYDREKNTKGVLLPQEITEFTNAGIACGVASVNLSKKPFREFNGFYMATSTYGSFSYLKYGEYRLFSQMAQDCPLKLGKVLWIVGHSGPETADDSRTHFGIFSPIVTQLFPKGHVINLYPWEANEVPVLLAAAFSKDVPIVALHLTRPPIEIPNRDELRIPSHFEAAKGAYIVRNYKPVRKKDGVVLVRGTYSTYNLLKVLDEIDRHFNVKIVFIPSKELFDMQEESYRQKVLSWEDWENSMVITNESLKAVEDWIAVKKNEKYCLSADWDGKWRTGGTLNEVIEEAHLDEKHILEGIERFVSRK